MDYGSGQMNAMEVFTLAVNKSYERCCGGLHEFCKCWRADFVLPLTALFDAESCFPAQSKPYLVPMFILCTLSLDII